MNNHFKVKEIEFALKLFNEIKNSELDIEDAIRVFSCSNGTIQITRRIQKRFDMEDLDECIHQFESVLKDIKKADENNHRP